jgi:LacI family transcriptional regulator
VVADYEACGHDAVTYLHGKGCKEIGLITGDLHLAPYKGRYDGYRRGVSELGLEEITSESNREVNSFRYGYDCANQLLDENPDLDAIMASVDVQGLGAIRAATERGLRIPEDIKVISLTGHRVGRMLETTMTSMEMPAFEMGRSAAKMIIDDIEADSKHKPGRRHLTFATTLVEREST